MGRFPADANYPANYFTAGGNLGPPPGSPGSLGPPTSVANWGMALGSATFKYIPAKHPIPGTLGSGTVIVELLGLHNYSVPKVSSTNKTIDSMHAIVILFPKNRPSFLLENGADRYRCHRRF